MDLAAEAIHQAYLRGTDPALLASNSDVVLFCQQVARPDFDAGMRQAALKRVAVIANSKIDNIEYVKKAQSAVIERFKRLLRAAGYH
jgi:hypothetical protein